MVLTIPTLRTSGSISYAFRSSPGEENEKERETTRDRMYGLWYSTVTDICFGCDRSAYVLAAHLPKLDVIPSIHADFGPYLAFDLNYPAIWALAGELYYFILTPSVTVSHIAITGYTYASLTRGLTVPF